MFPKDFIVERENVPIAGGIREGSGTVLYRAKQHPEWSVFELRGNWMEDELHGKASLYHNTHLLFTASYVYGVMYFKRERCDGGVLLTPDGCKPIRAPQPPRTRSIRPLVTASAKTNAVVANPVVPEVAEEAEERREEEYSDDSEVYEDDVVFAKKDKDVQKQVKESYLQIVRNMLVNDMTTKHLYHEQPNRPTILYLLSDYKTENYLLETQVQSGVPNGFGLLYSMRTLAPLCRVQFQLGVPTRVFLLAADKKASDYAIEVLDLSDEGERWEGEVRNLLPNGQGQFFNRDNVCVYEGAMVNGRANGLGTGFYPDLGVKAYFGQWKNNLRHGLGREFNRRGEPVRSGLWLNGSFATLETLPNNVNTPQLQPSSYGKLARVMYLNDSALSYNEVNTVEHFSLLKALFMGPPCVGRSDWVIRDMPMLEKVVVAIRSDGIHGYRRHPLRFVNCPSLREVWTGVSFAYGTVFVQGKDAEEKQYDQAEHPEPFEPRFVLGELKQYMKWKPKCKAVETKDSRYYRIENTRWRYGKYDTTEEEDRQRYDGMYSCQVRSACCLDPNKTILPAFNQNITDSFSYSNRFYASIGVLRPIPCSVC